MKRAWAYITTVLTAVIITGCVKPFNPTVSTVNQNILVVEGFINTGGDTTKIILSHTVTIGNKNSSVAETGATVTVENAAGASFAVPETTLKGSYASKGALALTSGSQYRLRIKTLGGKTYLSDLVDAKIAPPIDSIGHKFTNGGMQLYVNSHDDAAKSVYYKYTYSEAWIFEAKYFSNFISNGKDSALSRTPAQDIYFCYGKDSTTNIILNSTSALSKDVVYQFPVALIPPTSEKVEVRYSILLTQQTLSKDAYNFWQNLQKNTEQLGSIFDAQPSAISGNIHNINNAGEPVIGFISAGTVQKKRVYVNKAEVPASYLPIYPYTCNPPDVAGWLTLVPPPPKNYLYPWAYEVFITHPLTTRILDELKPQEIYTYSTPECADCTIRGTHNPPSFWKP